MWLILSSSRRGPAEWAAARVTEAQALSGQTPDHLRLSHATRVAAQACGRSGLSNADSVGPDGLGAGDSGDSTIVPDVDLHVLTAERVEIDRRRCNIDLGLAPEAEAVGLGIRDHELPARLTYLRRRAAHRPCENGTRG